MVFEDCEKFLVILEVLLFYMATNIQKYLRHHHDLLAETLPTDSSIDNQPDPEIIDRISDIKFM